MHINIRKQIVNYLKIGKKQFNILSFFIKIIIFNINNIKKLTLNIYRYLFLLKKLYCCKLEPTLPKSQKEICILRHHIIVVARIQIQS